MRDAKLGSSGYPRESEIGPGLRVLFAILGVAALVPVLLIALNEFRALSAGSRAGPLVMLAFCVVVVWGALSLLRAAVRGVAMVRHPGRRRPS